MLEAEAVSAEKDLAPGTRQAYAWQTTVLYFQLHFVECDSLRLCCHGSVALPAHSEVKNWRFHHLALK